MKLIIDNGFVEVLSIPEEAGGIGLRVGFEKVGHRGIALTPTVAREVAKQLIEAADAVDLAQANKERGASDF